MPTTNPENKNETAAPAANQPASVPTASAVTKKSKKGGCIIIAIVVTILVIVLGIFGVVALIGIFKGDDAEKESVTKMTDEELNQYDGQALKISSQDEKISGTAALTKTDKGQLEANFRIFIKDNIPSNHTDDKCHPLNMACAQLNTAYYYVGILQNSNHERELASQLIKRICTKENINYDPFDDYSSTCLEQKPETMEGITSNSFEMGMSKTFNSIDEILDISYLEVHDANDAREDECTQEGTMTTCNGSVDTAAGEKGKILKTYEMKLSE